MSAQEQYRAWCNYVFEHGTLGTLHNEEVKYIFGLPLRFSEVDSYMLTTESPALLEEHKEHLQFMINNLSTLHDLILSRKQDCELNFGLDLAQVTFVGQDEVAITFVITQSKSLTDVHATVLLCGAYLDSRLSKHGLTRKEWTITFGVVYTTAEEERHALQFCY